MTGYKNSHNTYSSHEIVLLRVRTYGIYSFSCTQGTCLTCVASSYSCGCSRYWNGEVLTVHSLCVSLSVGPVANATDVPQP